MSNGGKSSGEVATYVAPWPIYGTAWSGRPDKPFRLVVGSFVEAQTNRIELIQRNGSTFTKIGDAPHSYPATKILFVPDKYGKLVDMFATSGEGLRVWSITDEHGVKQSALLQHKRGNEFAAPLTSFDWNEAEPNLIATASIDTTCTIWNLETKQPRTQIIAHDREVYDICFASGTDLFATVGADGSMRTFDLRSLEQSTIIYEAPRATPLLRVAWNRQDPNLLAALPLDSPKVILIDIRMPSLPLTELRGHSSAVNSITWAPHSRCHLCTAGDDSQALVWDISQIGESLNPKKVPQEPILSYEAESEIGYLVWSCMQPDWVAITMNSKVQALKV